MIIIFIIDKKNGYNTMGNNEDNILYWVYCNMRIVRIRLFVNWNNCNMRIVRIRLFVNWNYLFVILYLYLLM